MANKVKYGLCDVHISKITINNDGTFTYGTPFAIPGAVSLTLDPSGDEANFSADNNAKYFTSFANNGYSGSLEMALYTQEFRTAILGETLDSNGALIEDADATISPFALGFRIDGDDKNTKFWYYNVNASRPGLTGNTTEDSITPQTETMNITAGQRPSDNCVRVMMTENATNTTAYNGFFDAVYEATI
jgi:phi13 family phage major tail protein